MVTEATEMVEAVRAVAVAARAPEKAMVKGKRERVGAGTAAVVEKVGTMISVAVVVAASAEAGTEEGPERPSCKVATEVGGMAVVAAMGEAVVEEQAVVATALVE